MSLLNTRTQQIRDRGNLDSKEVRFSRYGALQTYMRQTKSPTGIITPELLGKAKISEGSDLAVSIVDENSNVTIGNTRPLVIVDAENTSNMIVISFSTYSSGFTQVPVLFNNNEVGQQRDFMVKMKSMEKRYAEALNSAAQASLESNKTTVYNDLLLYQELADTIVARYDQREEIVGDLNVLMGANDFKGQIEVVANSGFESLVRKLAEDGLWNAKNRTNQWADKIWNFDNQLVNGSGKYSTAFSIEEDSLGMLFRHEREAIAGTIMKDGTEWQVDTLPNIGIPISTYFYESKGDFSAIAGAASADMDRVMKQHFGFAVDVAFLTAYISDTATRPTPISKVQINTAATDADTTAPTALSVASPDTLNFTLTFSEPVCTDQAGTLITGDIKDLFSITAATPTGVAITSAIAAADGLSAVFLIADGSGNLAAEDDVSVLAASLFDGAGNVMVAAEVADINVGGTAWELAD